MALQLQLNLLTTGSSQQVKVYYWLTLVSASEMEFIYFSVQNNDCYY